MQMHPGTGERNGLKITLRMAQGNGQIDKRTPGNWGGRRWKPGIGQLFLPFSEDHCGYRDTDGLENRVLSNFLSLSFSL